MLLKWSIYSIIISFLSDIHIFLRLFERTKFITSSVDVWIKTTFYGNWALTHSDELFKCIRFDMSCSNICHLRFIGVEYKSTETHWFQFSFSNSVACICLVNFVIFFFFCRNICSSRNKCNAFTIHFEFDVQMLNSFFYPSMHFEIYSFWFKYSSRGNCNARISNASYGQQPTQSVTRRTWKRDRERIFFSDLHAHIL